MTSDIIEDVGDEPTDWCSNVVLTPKKDGETVRASLDMTDVNRYTKRTRHSIPIVRELEARLNGAKYFSHLDMNDGYMQLELAEESRKLTTFYTHRGLKRFKRLHFRVNSAAEIFNEAVRKVVSLEPNAICIYDDILVYGAMQQEHDQALRHILQLWRSHRLTLSKKRRRFNLRSATFFGKVFSSEGISPDPSKVTALQAAGPRSRKQRYARFCSSWRPTLTTWRALHKPQHHSDGLSRKGWSSSGRLTARGRSNYEGRTTRGDKGGSRVNSNQGRHSKRLPYD